MGSRVGVVVRALAFHQCVPGSIPGPGVICGLSLLVLYSAPRGFSPGTPVFPSPQKPTFDLIWFDLFDLQSPQLVQHSCSARMIWDSNKVIIIIILLLSIAGKIPFVIERKYKEWPLSITAVFNLKSRETMLHQKILVKSKTYWPDPFCPKFKLLLSRYFVLGKLEWLRAK